MLLTPSSVPEVQEIVRRAIVEQSPLEPVGGGTQLHIGNPPVWPEQQVSALGLNRVVEYSPQDLVIVAEAGLTLAELQKILQEHGQILPLEVALPEAQTLGGIVASRANSLTRAANGSVRDWLVGCNVVCGEGQLVVGGGTVVKNVAGYDLPKMFCGSWGTLGIVTQVAFKVAPLQPATRTLLISLNAERNSEEALDALHAALTPSFTYILNPEAARAALGGDAPPAQFLAMAFDGRPEAVQALAAQAKTIIEPFAFQILELPETVGSKLRSVIRDLPTRRAPLTVRFHILPSQVGAFARMVEWTARRSGFRSEVFGDAGSGILWAHISPRPEDDEESEAPDESWPWAKFYADFRDKADRVGGSFTIERMPKPWRDAGYSVWSPIMPDVAWMKRLKQRFDPHNIFKPGRFVDGI